MGNPKAQTTSTQVEDREGDTKKEKIGKPNDMTSRKNQEKVKRKKKDKYKEIWEKKGNKVGSKILSPISHCGL